MLVDACCELEAIVLLAADELAPTVPEGLLLRAT